MRVFKYVVFLAFLSSCSLQKKLPEGSKLYAGAEVNVKSESGRGKAGEAEEVLSSNTFPAGNTMLLGFPYKVWFYYTIGEARKEKGLRSFLQRKLAEKPVFFNPSNLETNEDNLENIASNMGYFTTEVRGEAVSKKYKTKAVYDVELSPRYFIKEVTFDTADFSIHSQPELIYRKSRLRSGQPYVLQDIVTERQRISGLFQDDGYYLLDANRIIVRVDTNLNSYEANLHVELKEEFREQFTRRFTIRDVKIYTSFDNPGEKRDTLQQSLSSLQNTGLSVYSTGRYFKPKVFKESIVFRQGDLYSKERQEASYNRLANLKNFKFIRNKFDIASDSSANWLDVSYFLSPVKRKSLTAKLNGQTKNNGLVGAEVGASWQNRNFFHAAENLTIDFNIGRDLQFSNGELANNFTRFDLSAELVFPRFVLLFNKLKTSLSGGIPKSSVYLSYEELNQEGLYTQTSLNTGLTYYWRKNAEYDHTLTPLYFNLVKPRNVSGAFVDQVLESENPNDLRRYFEILDSRLILGIEYKLNYLPAFAQDRWNTWNLNFGLDIAGNIASLIASKDVNSENGTRNLFGVPFDQFVKLTFETRFYRKFGDITWASRLFSGFGLPYGNSSIIPQFKQYFIGGSNSLRGFRARSLGPGTVAPRNLTGSVFGNAISGDIRMEFNSEIRYKVNDLIELATFYDTGNIWFYNENSAFGTDGKFSKNFLNELAADIGLGLRLDFTYLILRGDLAIPVRKPWLREVPWVFDQIRFGQKNWRRENLVFSLAIAHPF
ncbi:BamA/TamA family outer membrane protein [Jiulongibacter sediminis]|uniref:translocation and assembly module lipoprotein TamL n=1 Tax=Jiulongibacter sediminis TaxID=1605367 RepID=UPI0026EEE194|nr:BamA/TamA family outer membrane protein [Jiulongibacter sediminis]